MTELLHPIAYEVGLDSLADSFEPHEARYKDGFAASEQLGSEDVKDPVTQYLNTIGKIALLTAEEEVQLAKTIEAGLYAQHKIAQHDFGSVTREELEMLSQEGKRAKAHFICANLRLVASIANKYKYAGLDFLEVIQEGNLGLIRAVEKFDYKKGIKFSTYSTWWIRQNIGRALANQSRPIRLPVEIGEKVKRIERLERDFRQRHGREPALRELAAAAGMDVQDVSDLKTWSAKPVSLDTRVGEQGESAIEALFMDTNELSVEELTTPGVLSSAIRAALQNLVEKEAISLRDANILWYRAGLSDGREHTLAELGKRYSISAEHTRRIEHKVKAYLKAKHPELARLL